MDPVAPRGIPVPPPGNAPVRTASPIPVADPAVTLGLVPGTTVDARVIAVLTASRFLLAIQGRELVAASTSDLKPGSQVRLDVTANDAQGVLLRLVDPVSSDTSTPTQRLAQAGLPNTAIAAAVLEAFESASAPLDPRRLQAAVTAATQPQAPAETATAHAILAQAGLPATPALVALASRAIAGGTPNLAAAVQDLQRAIASEPQDPGDAPSEPIPRPADQARPTTPLATPGRPIAWVPAPATPAGTIPPTGRAPTPSQESTAPLPTLMRSAVLVPVTAIQPVPSLFRQDPVAQTPPVGVESAPRPATAEATLRAITVLATAATGPVNVRPPALPVAVVPEPESTAPAPLLQPPTSVRTAAVAPTQQQQQQPAVMPTPLPMAGRQHVTTATAEPSRTDNTVVVPTPVSTRIQTTLAPVVAPVPTRNSAPLVPAPLARPTTPSPVRATLVEHPGAIVETPQPDVPATLVDKRPQSSPVPVPVTVSVSVSPAMTRDQALRLLRTLTLPDPETEGAPAVLRALQLAGVRPRPSPAGAAPESPEPPLAKHLAALSAPTKTVDPEAAPSPSPPIPGSSTLATATAQAARENFAEQVFKPKEFVDYDHVVPLPLAAQQLPTPARLAVANRNVGGGQQATFLRVDTELDQLGPVSVRVSGVSGGPIAVTLITTAGFGHHLVAELPALVEDLRNLGIEAGVRIAEDAPHG